MNTIKIALLLLITQNCISQTDYQSEFAKQCEINDVKAQEKLLINWEKESSNDPELYTSYFNYFFQKSREEVLMLSTDRNQDGEQVLALQDSLGNNSGFLGSQITYKDVDFNMAIQYIDKGISKFPNRLDMRFGKIHVNSLKNNWTVFTKEIIKAVEQSNVNNNQWVWTNNEIVENPKEFFLETIQSYVFQLFKTNNDELISNIKEISEKVIEHYPNYVPCISNISTSYLFTGDFDKAIEYLLRAERIDSKDYIVLSNIAYAYKMKGEIKKAIIYYEKTAEFGNEDAKVFANEQIKILKRN